MTPASFPCVFIEEVDNYVYTPSIDSGSNENFAKVTYEVNVYSNKQYGKKSEAKSIFNIVSDTFNDLGFVRLSKTPMGAGDGTKFRLAGRFFATVSKDSVIYR